jgi:hypothetical protein
MNDMMLEEINKLLGLTNKDTILVNFYAGPGAGKSTMCAGTYTELKWSDVDAEMAREYAKDKVWEKNQTVFGAQEYIFGKQYYKMHVLNGQVDVIVTDSPLLFSLVYDSTHNEAFAALVKQKYNEFRNLNYFVRRVKKYNPNGRHQTEAEAIALDATIKSMLEADKIEYKEVEGSRMGVFQVVSDVLTLLRKS